MPGRLEASYSGEEGVLQAEGAGAQGRVGPLGVMRLCDQHVPALRQGVSAPALRAEGLSASTRAAWYGSCSAVPGELRNPSAGGTAGAGNSGCPCRTPELGWTLLLLEHGA